MITRILLLLAVTISRLYSIHCPLILCIGSVSQRCLCRKVRNSFGAPNTVEDIQIIPPTPSCDSVSLKNGVQYCLDPSMKKVARAKKKNARGTGGRGDGL
uniref:Chemokine interleukin-8-like domain-containing protein n=1 Tax=Salmo trutta TaxID=8032 RepID=A0A673Y6B8_SALTR